jgi:hypothetical protein
MIEQMSLNKQDETMETLGRALMGILMGAGTICGIWLASGFVVVISKLMG